MTRFERIKRAIKGSNWESAWVRNMDLDGSDDILAYPYKKSTFVYVCVSTTAKAISQVPIVVQALNSKTDLWENMSPSHPLQLLFDNPSPFMDSYTFKEAVVGFLLLDGEVFVIPMPLSSSNPDYLIVVKSNCMEEIVDNNTNQLLGWKYFPEGNYNSENRSIILMDSEVCAINLWNPYNPYRGLAPLEAVKQDIRIDWKAGRYNEGFFDNGAVPGGVLSTQQRLKDTVFERTRKQFEERHRVKDNSHRVAVLEQGLQYSQMGLSHKDMEFLEQKSLNRHSIMLAYGMKEAVISITSDVNYATAEQERKEWWETTNIPIMRLILSPIQRKIIQSMNMRIIFDTSNVDALHEKFANKVKTGLVLSKMGYPINIINERLELGLPKVAWGDYWFMPNNVLPVLPSGSISDPPRLLPEPTVEEFFNPESGKVESVKGVVENVIEDTSEIRDFSRKLSRVLFDIRKSVMKEISNNSENFSIQKMDFSKTINNLEKFIKNTMCIGIDLDEDICKYINNRANGLVKAFALVLNSCNSKDEYKNVFNALREKIKPLALNEFNKMMERINGTENT